MELVNEFTVAAPIEKTWRMLLDVERVAACLPGASIEPAGEDGVHRGQMKVKLGPITTVYQGTARFLDVDEDGKVATIEVQAREIKGQGAAGATIRNSLEALPDGGTKVTAVTDLIVTGRQAQMGRNIMQSVASAMMDQFAARLEREILAAEAAPGEGAARAAGTKQGDDALDAGSVLKGLPIARWAKPAALAIMAAFGIAILAKALCCGCCGGEKSGR